MSNYYIHATDFVDMLVGPFSSLAELDAHVLFCIARGDAATMRAVDESRAQQIAAAGVDIVSPTEDREFNVKI